MKNIYGIVSTATKTCQLESFIIIIIIIIRR